MPSVIIHEKVGNYISKKTGLSSYDYYLGLLAPDTPNLEGFAPKEERWMAHQRKKDYDEWRASILKFYNQEKNNYPQDFIVGYYIHILTDIVYDDFIYSKVRDEIMKDYTKEESHDIMRKDMTKYSFDKITEIEEILSNSSKSYDILNISKEKLLLWKEKEIMSWSKTDTSKYITDEIINELEKRVYNELIKQIDI